MWTKVIVQKQFGLGFESTSTGNGLAFLLSLRANSTNEMVWVGFTFC